MSNTICWKCCFCGGQFSNPETFSKHKQVNILCNKENPRSGWQGVEIDGQAIPKRKKNK